MKLLLILSMLLLSACARLDDVIHHEVRISVIYADHDRINEEATKRGHLWEVSGFFDPRRNEIWCPEGESKLALAVCGHELLHAAKGSFHGSDLQGLESRQLIFISAQSQNRYH